MPQKIYKLTPVDKSDRSWKLSVFTGTAIVRADSEDRARRIADNALGQFVEDSPETMGVHCPWMFSDLVAASIDDSGDHSDEGDEGLILPDPREYA